MSSGVFSILPENFFSPLATPNRRHYASVNLLYRDSRNNFGYAVEETKFEVSLTTFPVITISGFQQKYNAVTGDEIKKTALINVLRRLSSCKLISVESQDYADPDGLIQLYPSIPLTIGREALDEAIALLENKDEERQ